MDYRTITNISSNQYQYIQNYMTVGSDGLLYSDDGYIGVALGSVYGNIGDKFEITLDTGIVLKVIKVDSKSDLHTIDGCYQYIDGSVMEMVVDVNLIESSYSLAKTMGDFNYDESFSGNIVNVAQILN